jgi:transposase-like protein
MLGSGRDRVVLWSERLRRYRRAGQTVAEFCRHEGVSVPSFYQWRKRLAQPSMNRRPKRVAPRQAHPLPAFQQVMLSGGAVVAVELPSGVRMELPAEHVQLVRAVVAELLEAEAGRLPGDV